MKETERLSQILTPFQGNVESLTQAASVKVNCIYRKLRRFLFCYKRFVDVLIMDTCKIYFSQHYDVAYNICKSVDNANSKQQVLLID